MDFFASAETWSAIPQHLSSPSLERAMDVLKPFRDNDEWYSVYSSQDELRRVQATEAAARVRAEAARQEAEQERDGLRDMLQQREAELAQLRALLQQLQEKPPH